MLNVAREKQVYRHLICNYIRKDTLTDLNGEWVIVVQRQMSNFSVYHAAGTRYIQFDNDDVCFDDD